jgi:competence protein ComEC
MSRIHFLNVLEGDCNIIQHDNGHTTVMDVSNASNDHWTLKEQQVRNSLERKLMENRNYVPEGKRNFHQKHSPDNPIHYLKKLGIKNIFRFIISHPDMDHLDGVRDFYQEFAITNTWDTNNDKMLNGEGSGRFNSEDWEFYANLRAGGYQHTKRLTLYSGAAGDYYSTDHLHVLAPTPALVKSGNESGDYNDLSYAVLYTPPKANGGIWKILFAGDGCDRTWEHIIANHRDLVSNIDVLMAPHHGRGSNRDFGFLDILKPKLTLMGNASSTHLAYESYRGIRLTNNQAGYVVIDINADGLDVYVKNKEFADWFRTNRNWNLNPLNTNFDGYYLCTFNP